jgi:ketosteroid isomerase-like protein
VHWHRRFADSARVVCGNIERMQSQSMERSDLEQLIALNEDYVQSVQRGDVQRFQELLGDDFLASNPDGSLVDKQQFLAQTALPVTITGLAAHDVRVRILGEVAIIHARTSYSTQTGERRTGRYTDIWAKRDGGWFGVAAHVTR